MKIGVKTFGDGNFLKHFEKSADFFEIMAAQKNDYSFLKNFSLPTVIHAEHHNLGINPADITRKEESLKSLNFARAIADMTGAKKIVVHAGVIEKGNKNHSLKNAINFFREINDERILIENLAQKYEDKKKKGLCSTPRKIKKFMKKTNKKFCFDINHALQGKNFNGKYNFIKKYIELNPAHYHIGGQTFTERKEHLCLENSELDLKKILSYYPADAEITLETEVDVEKTKKDIEIIRNVLKELGK
ncbi:MAG: sugar phosphate isomerase/epimerase [Candidatus Pacearchaeota archaeon]|nr:sugar phosphate isomerase/epimerase [Candidatus Pacearchaeota archaeon]